MQDNARIRATYADLEAVPPNLVAEILDGQLVTHPRPTPRNLRSQSALGGKLYNTFDEGTGGPGGWWIIFEPELHFNADVTVPDIAGWRRERMPEMPKTAYFTVAPDWICEVLSPSTFRYDRGEKRDIYARHGVLHYWLCDPAERLVEAFDLVDDKWLLQRTFLDDETVALAPFEAAPFSLGKLWS